MSEAELRLGGPRGEAAPPASAVEAHREEGWIADLLRWGVRLSVLLLVAAMLASLLLGRPLGGRLVPVGQLGELPLPDRLAEVGLLALACTPFARVALAAGLFARSGERRHAGIAIGVLVLLGISLLLGGEA